MNIAKDNRPAYALLTAFLPSSLGLAVLAVQLLLPRGYGNAVVAEEVPWRALDEAESALAYGYLSALWQEQRSAVLTAHLRYRSIISSTQPLEREKFLELLVSLDLISHPDNLQVLSQRVRRIPAGAVLAYDWGQIEVWQDGSRICERNHAAGEGGSTIVQDGGTVVSYSSLAAQAEAANTGTRSISRPDQVEDCRFVPRLPRESIRFIKRKSGLLSLRTMSPSGSYSDLTIDEATGMVLARVSYSADGKVRSECLQQGLTTFSENIVFPQLYVEATYRNEVLSLLKLVLLEDAVFNRSINDDVFTVAAPGGTVAVDARARGLRPIRLNSETDDVLSKLNSTLPLHAGDSDTLRRWFYGLAVLLLLILIGYVHVWRRRHEKHPLSRIKC